MRISPHSEDAPARWYYACGNHGVAGPVTLEALHFLLLKGAVTFDTLVLPERGGGSWRQCRAVFTDEGN
ncbi:MAG: hypothetical protein ACFUZC_19365 [Chthoniobacteraceae bacterium]